MVKVTRTELRNRFGERSRPADRRELIATLTALATVFVLLTPWWEPVPTRVAAGWTQLVVAVLFGLVSRQACGPRRRLGAKLIVVLALCAAAALLLDVGGDTGRRALLGAVLLASGSIWLWSVPETRGEEAFFGAATGIAWIVCALMILSTLVLGSPDAQDVRRVLKQVLMLQLVFAVHPLSQMRVPGPR